MNKTVLLIDDDEVCRMPAAEMLRRWQWVVIESDNGEDGIALAMRHRPDVILCDLFMPQRDGYQVCRAVRECSDLEHTRIIVVSGQDDDSDRQNAMEAGANEYLVKPLQFEKLKGALDKVMSSPTS